MKKKSEFSKRLRKGRRKMRIYQTVFTVLAVLLISTWALHAQTPPEMFAAGNSSYENGDYAQAVDQYNTVLAQGQTANVQFNLANSYYKLGNYGPAIYHYEKALVLNPNNPDIAANLKLAQQAAQVPESHTNWLDQLSLALNVNTWVWIGCIAFWLSLACFIIPRLYKWKSPLRPALVILFALITITSGVSLYGYHIIAKEGVSLKSDTPLKLAPTSTSPTKAFLAAGQSASISNEHAPYYFVHTANGKSGWVSNHNS